MKVITTGNPLIATAPRYKIEVRFTNTYRKNQKIAMINATDSLYRSLKTAAWYKFYFLDIPG